MKIITIKNNPELIEIASKWFHDKWSVPEKAYMESMKDSVNAQNGVPSWYVILNDEKKIVAGLGVIENDFHKSPELAPNICAVFVEEEYRHQGIAKMLLDNACEDLRKHGVNNVYLITSHTEFYERCGWTFYGMIEENNGNMTRMYRYNMEKSLTHSKIK